MRCCRYNDTGTEAYEQGLYAEAEEQWLAALEETESFGPQDPRLTATRKNLADLYYAQGNYAEAAPLYRRSLEIAEKAFGAEHPNVATSIENYAALLGEMGREDEAADWEARAKAIRVRQAQQSQAE